MEEYMRYYQYGGAKKEHELEAKEKGQRSILGKFGQLIIDDDTIYEIDEECLRCREGGKKQ